jgi:hypothetical protein
VRRARALLALTVALPACASAQSHPGDYRRQAAHACAGATTGAHALAAGGPARRVEREIHAATRAAKALARAHPPEELGEAHREALHTLQGQVARLRLVRDQMERGSEPRVVLDAARAGLRAGDRQATARLAAVGIEPC